MKGRPSKVSDDQVRRLRAWKPLKAIAREIGIDYYYARAIRYGRYRKSVQ